MKVKLGIDVLYESADAYGISKKRIGLITNATGISGGGKRTIDLLMEKAVLTRLFAPEHGIRGELEAGVKFEGYTDAKTGVPVVSLYGENRRPAPEYLNDLDAVVFDIQDAGARFYTYLYTMAYVMEVCAENSIKMIVADRPNPIGGRDVNGNILTKDYRSFVGYYPITQRYGLTIGECARMFNDFIFDETGRKCDLTVAPMEGWKRDMYYGDTGLIWTLPSPNLPAPESCLLYPGTCVFEGTNVSEGRGTAKPFQFIGAPWIDAESLALKMNGLNIKGAFFRPHYFTPSFSKHEGTLCGGVEPHVTDRGVFNPVLAGISLLFTIRENYKEFQFLPPAYEGRRPMIDLNTGFESIRLGSISLGEVLNRYKEDSREFLKIKTEYHIYE